jgi:AhpD family alkylhydroperoxidase
METDYVAYRKHLDQRMGELGHELSGAMGGFVRLHHKAVEDGALSHRTKELMALALAVVLRCDGCIAYHAQDAIAAGASRQEIIESIGVAVLMGGAPATVYAAHVLDAVAQILEHEAS